MSIYVLKECIIVYCSQYAAQGQKIKHDRRISNEHEEDVKYIGELF